MTTTTTEPITPQAIEDAYAFYAETVAEAVALLTPRMEGFSSVTWGVAINVEEEVQEAMRDRRVRDRLRDEVAGIALYSIYERIKEAVETAREAKVASGAPPS